MNLNINPLAGTVQNADLGYSNIPTVSKPIEAQSMDPNTILKIGNTIGSIFTPAFFISNIGNTGFDYGVKAGKPVGYAIGTSVDNIITQVKNLPANIASGVQGFSINIAGIFVIIILGILLFKKAVA